MYAKQLQKETSHCGKDGSKGQALYLTSALVILTNPTSPRLASRAVLMDDRRWHGLVIHPFRMFYLELDNVR